MKYLLFLLLAGCCTYVEPGEMRYVGSAIGDGVANRPESIMLYDPKTQSFFMVPREYWEAYLRTHPIAERKKPDDSR